MEIKEFFRDKFKINAFNCTMWVAVLGLVLMVGVAAINTGV